MKRLPPWRSKKWRNTRDISRYQPGIEVWRVIPHSVKPDLQTVDIDKSIISDPEFVPEPDSELTDDTRPASLPPDVADLLGPNEKWNRHRHFGDGCPLCPAPGNQFRDGDEIRRVLLTDGSRTYAHASCLLKTHAKCIHDLDAGTCAICDRPKLRVLTSAIVAEHSGKCVVCDKPYAQSTYIRKYASRLKTGWGHYWHANEG